MKNSDENNAFADVNPFLNLDRARFCDAEKRKAEKRKNEPSAARPKETTITKKKVAGCKVGEDGTNREGVAQATMEEEGISFAQAFMGERAINDPEREREADIFIEAMMGEVKPLSGKGRDIAPRVVPRPTPQSCEPGLDELLEGKLEFAELHKGEYMEGHVIGLDPLIMQKLRSGAYSHEGHLDLHGLNAEQAFMTLREFFRQSWHKGMRMALVVTGRGRNSPQGMGVLRDKMHLWLTQEPLKRIVLAFCTARPSDGGPGSIYVLLRKFKKKGKVFWDRLPPDGF